MTEIYLFYCKAIIQINTNILNEMLAYCTDTVETFQKEMILWVYSE